MADRFPDLDESAFFLELSESLSFIDQLFSLAFSFDNISAHHWQIKVFSLISSNNC